MIDAFAAVVLGVVQGIAAWIPVSSKTQVILFGKFLFGLDFQTAVSFALLVHVGDLLATFYLFRKEILGFLGIRPKVSDLKAMEKAGSENRLFWFAAVSVFFSGIVGLPAYLLVRQEFSELPGALFLALVGALLVVLGVVMWLSSKKAAKATTTLKKKISLSDTVLAGCAQGLSVMPGISRSGMTESALLLRGYAPSEAVRLSFFMSIPMVMLSIAAFFTIEGFGTITLAAAALGIAASFISSFLMMRFMLDIAKKAKFYWFNIAIGLLAMTPLALQLIVG